MGQIILSGFDSATGQYTTTENVIDNTPGITQVASNTLFTQTADATVSNTTTETTLIGSGTGTVTLPANFITVGKTFRIRMWGLSSQAVGNTTLKIKLGSVVLASTGAVAVIIASDALIQLEAYFTCRSTGGSGTVYSQGIATIGATSVQPMTNVSVATIDTTISNAIDVTITMSSASVSNIVVSNLIIIEVLN